MSKYRVQLVGRPSSRKKMAGLKLYDLRPDETLKRITELASSLPSLKGADGVMPWKPKLLNAWGLRSSDFNAKTAVRFVLAVWAVEVFGGFDLLGSFHRLDREHQAVITKWAENPWWCSSRAGRQPNSDV